MRFPALLFTFYLLVLSCLPCADEAGRVPVSEQVTVSVQHTNGGEEHSQSDWCSPLCQCHCCPGVMLLPVRTDALALVPAPAGWGSRSYGLAGTDALLRRPLATPWQPPQGA